MNGRPPAALADAYELIQDLHACACDALEIMPALSGAATDLDHAYTILKGARDSAAGWIADFEADDE